MNIPCRTILRNRLWYSQFDHVVKINLPEASSLRTLNHDRIDRVLDMKSEWGRRMSRNYPGGSWIGVWEKVVITQDVRENVHAMADFLLSWVDSVRVVISGDWMYLYSQGPDLANAVERLDFVDAKKMCLTRLDLRGPKDALVLKRANHAYRTYFRWCPIDSETRQRLCDLLCRQPDVRMSPSLTHCFVAQHKHLFDYYFIDHNSENILTLLALCAPGLTRKTLPIVADK